MEKFQDLTALARETLAALTRLPTTEHEVHHDLAQDPLMPIQQVSPQIALVADQLIASGEREDFTHHSLPHALQPTTSDLDLSSKLRQSPLTPSPSPLSPSPDTVPAKPSTPSDTANSTVKVDPDLDLSRAANLHSPAMSLHPAMALLAEFQQALPATDPMESPGSTDSAGVPPDQIESATPALLRAESEIPTGAHMSPKPSAEEMEVENVKQSVKEAAAEVQVLQERADIIQSQKESYAEEARNFGTRVEGIEATVKDLKAEAMGVDAQKKALEAQKKALQAQKNQIEMRIKRKKEQIAETKGKRTKAESDSRAKQYEQNIAMSSVNKAAIRHRDLEKQLKDAEWEAQFVIECPDAGYRHFVRKATQDRASNRLINEVITGEAVIGQLDLIEDMLEQAEESTKTGVKIEVTKFERASTEQIKAEIKPEHPTIKTEHTGTSAPISSDGNPSSPTAQNLLESYRRMRASQKEFQAQLQKVNSLKRKHEDDADDRGFTLNPRRVKPTRFVPEYQSDSDDQGEESSDSGADSTDDEDEDEGDE